MAACLAEATGLPAPGPALARGARPATSALLLDLASARRLGAQPVARADDRLEVVTRYGAALREIGAWAGGLDLGVRCYIVPEVRFEALLALVHGKPVPPRFAALLGRIVGRARARQLAEPDAPAARAVARPLVETGPVPRRPARPGRARGGPRRHRGRDAPCRPRPPAGARPAPAPPPAAPAPAPPPGRGPAPSRPAPAPQALPHPRPRARNPSPRAAAAPAPAPAAAPERARPARGVAGQRRRGPAPQGAGPGLAAARPQPAPSRPWDAGGVAAAGRGREAMAAVEALAELRDRQSIPVLLDRLGDSDELIAEAAQAALRAITRHDFGGARWRWTRWWREWKERHRVEWLIDALTEKNAELRLEAAQELEELSGRYFGYHFDLGRREREEARRRWFDWWQNTGKASWDEWPPEPWTSAVRVRAV